MTVSKYHLYRNLVNERVVPGSFLFSDNSSFVLIINFGYSCKKPVTQHFTWLHGFISRSFILDVEIRPEYLASINRWFQNRFLIKSSHLCAYQNYLSRIKSKIMIYGVGSRQFSLKKMMFQTVTQTLEPRIFHEPHMPIIARLNLERNKT